MTDPRLARSRHWFPIRPSVAVWLAWLTTFAGGCAADPPVAADPATTAESRSSRVKAMAGRKGTDWPQFLGPQQTGISRETGLLKEWPAEGPPIVWQIDVGTGYSAPSVRGDQLVLHHCAGDEEVIESFDARSGRSLWKQTYASDFRDPYGYNNGPRCTPLLTEDRCFTLGAGGMLTCVHRDGGKVVWQRDLSADFTIPAGFFGVGATPILEGDRLIVLVGGQPNAGVVAFDAQTGKTLWESVGQSTWDGADVHFPPRNKRTNTSQADLPVDDTHRWRSDEMVASYSSPLAATIHNERHILCLMRQGLVSLDPETGNMRFKYWFRARVHESVNAARPVVIGDTILLSAAYRVGSALLRVNPDNASYVEQWRDSANMLTHWSTPIAIDGHAYGFSGRHEKEGELRCINLSTGDIVWKTKGLDGGLDAFDRGPNGEIVNKQTGAEVPWPFYGRGSATLVDGQFIVLAERGTLALVMASVDGWQEISRCTAPRMKYPSWTAPVLSRGLLYLRCEDSLVCLDLRSTANP